ncbi:hypothetical protein BSL78_14561 [Apostichopus japonicus]|uniref:Uncharacterized protein n=1 Tax=Stichopus japonicus TaxID=307972 RepID=A0A2G8KKP2_STIJA|nr:hypothetical protein BSL78_14561 [Apostichopus japonicus]
MILLCFSIFEDVSCYKMELTLSLLNVGQLLTILHSVAFSLASNVSVNIEVSVAGLVDGELHAVSTPEGPTKDIHSSYPAHVTLSHYISHGEVNPLLHSKLTTLSIISNSVIEKFTGSPYLRDNSKAIYKLNQLHSEYSSSLRPTDDTFSSLKHSHTKYLSSSLSLDPNLVPSHFPSIHILDMDRNFQRHEQFVSEPNIKFEKYSKPTPHMSMMATEIPFIAGTYSHTTSVVTSNITFIHKTGSPSRSTIAPFKPSENDVPPNTLSHSLSSTLKPSVFTSGVPFTHEIQSPSLNTMTPSLFKSSQEAGLPSSSDFHSFIPSPQTLMVTSRVSLIPEIDLHSLSSTPPTSFTSLDMSYSSRRDFHSLMSTPFTSVGTTEKHFVAKTGSLPINTVPYTSVNTSSKESQPTMSSTYITGSPQTLEVPSGHIVMFTSQTETHFMTNAISQGFVSSNKPFAMNPVSDAITTVLHSSRNLSTKLHSVESIHKTSTATMITTSISKSQSNVDVLPQTSTTSYSSTLVNSFLFLNPSTNPSSSSQSLTASHVSHQPHLSSYSVSSSSVSSSHFTNILSTYFLSVSAAFPDSTSEPVTMVTIRPSSTIGGSLYTTAITSSFPSMTFLPSNSLAITSSNAGILPTMILTGHSTSEVPPFQTSKLNLHPSTTLEPSFISRTSQSYVTPKLPSSSIINLSSTVATPSTTSEELNEMSSSTNPPGTATSAVPVDNTTSAVTVDNTTSAVTVDNTTSAVMVDNTTSVVTVDNITSAVTVDNTTSAVTVDNTTSAVTVDNITSAVTVDNTTSAVTVDNSTFPAPLESTTMSSPVETLSTNNPTLDKSFSTREYWVIMELSTPLDMDIQDGGFLKELELSLALSYSKGKEIEVEKDAEVKQLIQNLNPEEDILLSRRRKRRRKKRASTIDGHTAQIIDLSRNVEIASSSELVFYIMSGGVNIPAVTCATTFSELSVQELTLLLGVVVLTPVSSYDAVPTTASPPADSNLVILLSIFIPLVILSSCMCCCCMFCVICGPKKKENERTMAPDTFRMLEFKQKFPYKPYPPNQTPRDFKEQPSDDDIVLGTEINLGGDFIEVDPTPRVFPDGDNNFNLESFQLPETIPKTNRGLEPSVTEPPVSSSQNELLDKPNHNRNVSDSEATMRNLPHLQPSSRSNSEYKKAQREISKILEPGDRSKPRKKRKKQEEQSSSQLTNEDEKFSRGPTKVRKEGLDK